MSFTAPINEHSEAFIATTGIRAAINASNGSLGHFSVSPTGQNSAPSDTARAAAAQLGIAQLFSEADIEGRIPFPKRNMRKRIRGRFVKGGPDEALPEGSVEQDNRDQGQSTVAITKRIRQHMREHGIL